MVSGDNEPFFSPLDAKVPILFTLGRKGADAALSDGCNFSLMVLTLAVGLPVSDRGSATLTPLLLTPVLLRQLMPEEDGGGRLPGQVGSRHLSEHGPLVIIEGLVASRTPGDRPKGVVGFC